MNKRNLWTIFFLLLFFTVVMGFVAMEENSNLMFSFLAVFGVFATICQVGIIGYTYSTEDLN